MTEMPKVKPVLRLVPNGFSNGKLRMTLIVTPARATNGIPINEWPSRIRSLIVNASNQVDVYQVVATEPTAKAGQPRPAMILQSGLPQTDQGKINKAWSTLGVWDGTEQIAERWETLLKTIDLSLASQSFANGLATPVSSTQVDLHADDSSYKEQPVKPGETLTVKAVHPVRQGDLALGLEVNRAVRVHERVVSGAPQPRRLRDPAVSDTSDVDASYVLKPKDDKKAVVTQMAGAIDAEIAAQKRAELIAALAVVQGMQSAADTITCNPIPKPKLGDDFTPPLEQAQASHTAGTWPQKGTTTTAQDDNVDRLVASYQAIVSSPVWARFFGFAFDVELPNPVAGESWVSAGGDPAFTIAARTNDRRLDPGEPAKDVNRVWTAVGTDGWPRSDTSSNLSEGLFRMSVECSDKTQLPRYDVVTLDVRHAAEAAVRPLSPDGGEQRGFRTAGMTLIDRRRAEDVRGQIGRTSTNGGKAVITLFADDLVVGRRLDAGIERGSSIAWRALGARSVSYGLRGDDDTGDYFFPLDVEDQILQPRQASGTRTIEEAIIYPAARLAPSPGGTAVDRDVFVDEAYATWAGAPMGVSTAPPIATEGDRKVENKVAFLQRQNLPTVGGNQVFTTAALAPPLRYGYGYRFGMRAVFLGGHSLSVDVADDLYNRDKQAFTYPSDPKLDHKSYPTRRFVRHEAIGAPMVLLPGSVLGTSISDMDFETVQSAVLRSLPKGYAQPAQLEPKVRGRPYVTATDRMSSETVVRIFVPPQVALEELLRAGKLDASKNRATVIAGGLAGVAFGVFRPKSGTLKDPTRQGGFPIAMIDEQRAFGFEPTRRKLIPGWNRETTGDKPEPAPRGAAIFAGTELLAKSGADAAFIRRPYYPDPYAQRMFLRLRRRSDGRYVGPAREVAVYDEKSVYPNAMPTVVVIKKADENSVAGEDSFGAPVTITTDGNTFGQSGSQRAQKIELTLSQGADFDLEAFYLPSAKDLAQNFALTEMIGAYRLDKGILRSSAPTSGSDADAVSEHVTTGFFNVPNDAELESIATELIAYASALPSSPVENSITNAAAATAPAVELDGGGPIEDIAGFVTVRVAHAVNRPLTPAKFDSEGSEFRIYRTGLNASSVDDTLVGGPDDVPRRPVVNPVLDMTQVEEFRRKLDNRPGSNSYVLSGRVAFDRRTTSAIEILATCVSPRDVLIDDPSRRRAPKARVAGAWPNKTVVLDEKNVRIPPKRVPADELDVYGFSKIDLATGKVSLHRSEVMLLRIDNLGGPGLGPLVPPGTKGSGAAAKSEDVIELSLAHLAAMIGKPVVEEGGATLFTASQLHAFPDSKARHLQLRLRAVSRFGPDFETAARWTNDDDSALPVVRVRQPLQPPEQSVESAAPPGSTGSAPPDPNGTITVWLPSSVRPAKCACLSPVPVFRITTDDDVLGGKLTRDAGVRIYLERGWFASGEGELLGVIVPSADVVAQQLAGTASDEQFGPIGPFISRWGGDPIRQDHAQLCEPLTQKTFQGKDRPWEGSAPILVEDVVVPIQIPRPPGAQDNVTVLEKTDLLTFEPRFDVDREQWFVDLRIPAPMTPNLFVRLGLVRYQPNAISKDLQVSEPVVVWSQLFPERSLDATVFDLGEEYQFEATVSGPTHKGVHIPKNPVPEDKEAEGRKLLLGRPTVRFRLVHECGEGDDLRRTEIRSWKGALGNDSESLARCKWVKCIPKSELSLFGKGTVYVYAEEIETFMPATYAREPVYVEDIFSPETYVHSGPRFAARVNIRTYSEDDWKK
ncbi:hypothetical protein CN311_16050 [Mesorhizobium sanjuanii]|uniref:Uncharacterized protein n=1 Tax=Mesorhizobium sanjuanii TaxID=2037900 RepID=A0A2A6FF83_9HYPH|nr:hypothetical protein [Mesorhizobium sanjuanii]PDQ20078.1 hypothetical protein CN311_16050 [Mesorhizobium sanjuanii]